MSTTSGRAEGLRRLVLELGALMGADRGAAAGGTASVGGSEPLSHATSNQAQPSNQRAHARGGRTTLALRA